LPSTWIDCTTKLAPTELPPDTELNTNGAGDAFTAGLLVAALLRHTGLTVRSSSEKNKSFIVNDDDSDSDLSELLEKTPTPAVKSKQKMTPYSLYMKENYISLKAQCQDDKKAIFTKCHDMWENESADVKAMYERKCSESSEDEEEGGDEESYIVSSAPPPEPVTEEETVPHLRDRSLNLESAAQFANLVASYHIDVSTRDADHLDISVLLERAMIFTHGLEEI